MRYFILFLFLDTITKALAVYLQPENSVFMLKYNPNMLFSLEASTWIKFVLPLLISPAPFLFYKYLKPPVNQVCLSLIYAGMVGNYLGRFSDQGVVDFINCQLFVCNLADLFLWAGALLFYLPDFKITMPFLSKKSL